jgi:hypothetical protein
VDNPVLKTIQIFRTYLNENYSDQSLRKEIQRQCINETEKGDFFILFKKTSSKSIFKYWLHGQNIVSLTDRLKN